MRKAGPEKLTRHRVGSGTEQSPEVVARWIAVAGSLGDAVDNGRESRHDGRVVQCVRFVGHLHCSICCKTADKNMSGREYSFILNLFTDQGFAISGN